MNDRTMQILKVLGYVTEDDDAEQPKAPEPQPDDGHRQRQLDAARVAGLPDALADRLAGESDAALVVDAQRLAKALQPSPTNQAELAALTDRARGDAQAARSVLPRQSGDVPPVGEWKGANDG